MYNDGINFIVICFFKEQVELLAKRKSFEMDMGFKRLRDKNEKEIVIAGWIPEVNKGMLFYKYC